MKKPTVITAVDIGTTKICAIIAIVRGAGELEVKGIGIAESSGLDKGIVKDIHRTSESIKQAIDKAQKMAEHKAENIYIGIAGEHIKSRNATGRISISESSGKEPAEVQQEHIEAVINDAKRTVKIQQGHENLQIIHGIPQYYDIDNQKGIINPINMSGFHLTAHVHVVLADMNAIRNILKCLQMAGYQERNVVLEPIASAMAVLNEDEKDLGCILLDIGGGTTDIAVFYHGSVRFSTVKPMGGANITHDLAVGLRTPPASAEEIKIGHGSALPQSIDDEATIEIPGIGGRDGSTKKQKFVAEIIESRMREIFELAYSSVFNNYNKTLMTAGIVITGGAALLQDTERLAADVFNLPVKVGYPDLSLLTGPTSRLKSPMYATSIGLLYYALGELPQNLQVQSKTPRESTMTKMKKWFSGFSDFV
ncbi:MAG: cell division protein FtsA [Candidatus Cloacimonetes bacterium]|nr:cell division protein FtsA [Candidatus Cloacimonadota bacterium]